jgi:hypothetical protein
VRKTEIIGLLAACALLLSGCGSGSSSASPSSAATATSSSGSNVQAIVVDSGPSAAGGTINEPFVSVTICAPANPSNCQTIDHVLVDTGSEGLRILASVLSPTLAAALPQQADANNNAIVECTQFADGYTWGPIKTVNMKISGETANALPMQVIGDLAYSNFVPEDCSSSGPAENTVVTFGANGVLGIGAFAQDCGGACVGNAASGVYYSCSSSCQPIGLNLAQQMQNPITLFATDNNGVILSLPAISATGATSASGTMTFGVGTQSNNGLGTAKVYTLNPISGYFTTIFNGVSYTDSFLDSGSNALFFNDSSIPQCSDGSGFYCPSSILSLSAVNQGQNGTNGTVSFSVGNADTINPTVTAFDLLAGTNGDSTSFDWGLPFFFGRSVYTVIEGYNTTGGTGPYFAY